MELLGTSQSPKSKPWKVNDRGPRTVDEAIELAKHWGIEIPSDIAVVVDEWEFIVEPNVDARYFRWKGLPTAIINWSELYASSGKIPVLLKPAVLWSDEAIVAVISHELYELNALRHLFAASGGQMRAERLRDLIHVGIPRNLHDQAWDVADQLVERMRAKP